MARILFTVGKEKHRSVKKQNKKKQTAAKWDVLNPINYCGTGTKKSVLASWNTSWFRAPLNFTHCFVQCFYPDFLLGPVPESQRFSRPLCYDVIPRGQYFLGLRGIFTAIPWVTTWVGDFRGIQIHAANTMASEFLTVPTGIHLKYPFGVSTRCTL